MSTKSSCLLLIGLLFIASCGKTDLTSASSATATPFASAIGSIASGVATAGSGLKTTAFTPFSMVSRSRASAEMEATSYFLTVTPMVATLCDTHGSPIEIGTTTQISQMDYRYPFIFTYCAMTVNSGDTVRGSFDLVEGLICSLEKGGIAFAGAVQTISINFLDTACWPTGAPGGGEVSSGTLTATGSAPASFNSHFEKGVSFTFVQGSDTLTFKVAANIATSSIEFIAHESWTSGNKGVMAGSLDKTTGILKFEKRDERIRLDCADSSCGWNRHTRIKAVLAMSGAGEPTGLTSLSYGYADVQASAAALNIPSTATSMGDIVTASGTLSGGIQARGFATRSKTVAQMKDPAQWLEIANVPAACMTGAAGITSGTNCAANSGIANFTTNTNFALLSTDAQLSPDAWLATFGGFNFSAVDLDVDQAFTHN